VRHPRPSLLADHTRQHPLLATQTSAVATTTCLDVQTICVHIPERCAHPRSCRRASSPLPTGIGCGTLAPASLPDHTLQHPLLATQATPNLGSGNHDMSRLSAFAYPDDAPIRGLADVRLAHSQRVLGAAPSPLAPRPDTHGTTALATQTPLLPANYLHASPFDARRSTRIHLAAAPFRASRT
jgi:hypothetical protein